MTTQVLDRATIELARIETLNALDAAKERLDEASLAAALPGGDDTAMRAAQKECDDLRQKLQGLAHGQKQVEAAESEAKSAEQLAHRREHAVQTLALVNRRYWATERLDAALAAAGVALDDVETLGNEITFGLAGMDERDRNQFLMNIDLLGMTDTGFKVSANVSKLIGNYARQLPLTRPAALKALAKLNPDVLDADVQNEALARAREEDGAHG